MPNDAALSSVDMCLSYTSVMIPPPEGAFDDVGESRRGNDEGDSGFRDGGAKGGKFVAEDQAVGLQHQLKLVVGQP